VVQRDEEPAVRRSGTVVPARPAPAEVADQPVRQPKPSATPKPVAAGAWRVQLGAFRDAGNARGLFARLARGPLSGKQQYLVKSGAVSRLLAGPYASQADASRACGPVRAAGSECVPVKG
jgi:cell division septation protein DedD